MILSEIKKNLTKQKGIDQTQQILVNCDKCNKEYYISLNHQKSGLKKYDKDLCRGCKQKEQIKLGIRGKQYINAGISAKNKMEGKTFEDLYGIEKSLELKKQRSLCSSGKNNPNYGGIWHGLHPSVNQKGKVFNEIYSDEKSKNIKQKISDKVKGKNNPMYGKPSPNGSGNGWSGWYKGWYFRSLHELSYMVNVIERFGLRWRSAECSELKVSYIGFKNEEHTYSADFIINEKYLIEIKPKKLHNSKMVQLKKEAAIIFCNNKNLTYKLTYTLKLLSFQDIKKLIKNKDLIFLERYKEKFKRWKEKLS